MLQFAHRGYPITYLSIEIPVNEKSDQSMNLDTYFRVPSEKTTLKI